MARPPVPHQTQSKKPLPARGVHVVDWWTLRAVREVTANAANAKAAEENEKQDANTAPKDPGDLPDGGCLVSAETLAEGWLRVAQLEQKRQRTASLTERDKCFIEVRVAQSMREVDPKNTNSVDLDEWVHHMLLTRASPMAMRAMLQINTLLEAAVDRCPAIMISLQHALEVATASLTLANAIERRAERGKKNPANFVSSSTDGGAQDIGSLTALNGDDMVFGNTSEDPPVALPPTIPTATIWENFDVNTEPAVLQEVGGSSSSYAHNDRLPSMEDAGGPLSFVLAGEVIETFCRKLWHLRPQRGEDGYNVQVTGPAGDWITKMTKQPRGDSPDTAGGGAARVSTEAVNEDPFAADPASFAHAVVKALDLEAASRITRAEFLAVCLGRRENEVTLHLYDLSKGMAARLSPYLVNERIEGVWHTGVVVFGREYYFGGDIYYDLPRRTGFGPPNRAVHLGVTLWQREELHAFIVDELKPVFSREAYDAARNNCNHFSDRVAMYLVGKHIPDYVRLQPELMIKTGFGRTVRPFLTRWLGLYFEPVETSQEISTDDSLRLRKDGCGDNFDWTPMSEKSSDGSQFPWGAAVTL